MVLKDIREIRRIIKVLVSSAPPGPTLLVYERHMHIYQMSLECNVHHHTNCPQF